MNTSNEPNPPGTIEMIPKISAMMYNGTTSINLIWIPIKAPITRKNKAAQPHSTVDPMINANSRFHVKSLKNSLSLNFVTKNNTGKYNPPANNQIEYLWKIASDGMANIITNEIQQKIERPASRNNAILEIAYKISFLLAPSL